MIGIIGYGMVGKAVDYGFNRIGKIISDPKYNTVTIKDVCAANPVAIFVCVPTPTDDTNYDTLRSVLKEIRACEYFKPVIVKSTILPQYIKEFDVVYNPEFLSRATSNQDFVNPPFVLLGGKMDEAQYVADIYRSYSMVNMDCVKFTDIKTAALAKYTMNSFYATKVTFMNQMYDVAEKLDVKWDNLVEIISSQPWMGTHHFQVPGPDGKRGFGGPCLPKDTEALVKEYDIDLLKKVLELNTHYRGNKDGN